MNLSIKIINNTSEFISFKEKWKVFEQLADHTNITSSYDWLYNWWQVFEKIEDNTFGYNKELLIICLYNNEKLIGIAPFVKLYRKFSGVKISFIEFLTQQWGGTFLDIIGIDLTRQHIEFIFYWLYNNLKFDLLFLRHIPEQTHHFNKKDLHLLSACPQINLQQYNTLHDYINDNYSKNLKQNLRTALNRVKKNNHNIDKVIEEIDDNNFRDVIRISKSKILDKKICLYENNTMAKFYNLICNKMQSNVVFIKIDGKKVAYRINILFNKVKYCLDASYDRSYRKYELGAMSVDLNIKDSFEKSLDIHCLGPGVDNYKLKFTKDIFKIYMYAKKGNSILSFLLIPLLKWFINKKSKMFKDELKMSFN